MDALVWQSAGTTLQLSWIKKSEVRRTYKTKPVLPSNLAELTSNRLKRGNLEGRREGEVWKRR